MAPMALAFVEALTGDVATPCCWRTFHDDPAKKGVEHGRNYTGPLAEVWPALARDEAEGRGVFILPNAGGHLDNDIQEIRAVWVDCDGAPVADVLAGFKELDLPAHLICRREDAPETQAHVYTLVEGLAPAKFTAIQRALAARLDTDRRVINPSRVMRLPGTLHQKPGKEPSRYRFEDCTSGLGRLSALPAKGVLATVPTPPEPVRRASVSAGEPVTETMLREMLAHVDPGLGRLEWLAVLGGLFRANVVTDRGEPDPDYDGHRLAQEWSCGDLWRAGA